MFTILFAIGFCTLAFSVTGLTFTCIGMHKKTSELIDYITHEAAYLHKQDLVRSAQAYEDRIEELEQELSDAHKAVLMVLDQEKTHA